MLFLMIEAVMMFSPYWSLLPKKYHRKFYLDVHSYMQVLTSISFSYGFYAIYINKENNKKPHFTSYHGIFGLIQAALVLIPVINGTVSKYAKFLPTKLINVAKVKAIHGLMGVIAISFAILNLISGFFTKWFISQTAFIIPYLFSITLILINGFVVIRALRNNSRIPSLFQSKKWWHIFLFCWFMLLSSVFIIILNKIVLQTKITYFTQWMRKNFIKSHWNHVS